MYLSTHAAAMGIRAPLSQTLFSVAEVSKQGICPDKCRKAACGTHSFRRLSCFRGHPLTPGTCDDHRRDHGAAEACQAHQTHPQRRAAASWLAENGTAARIRAQASDQGTAAAHTQKRAGTVILFRLFCFHRYCNDIANAPFKNARNMV